MGYPQSSAIERFAGVALSHVSHLMAVLILYELTLIVYSALSQHRCAQLALLAASLHIISPAGMFLSAPYIESSFSVLNFLGFYCHARANCDLPNEASTREDALTIIAGILFGVATTFRGNGLFSGLILVYDAIICCVMILRHRQVRSNIRRLLVTCLAGSLMACIMVIPQSVAYDEYCTAEHFNGDVRPWCSDWIPSIYGWVQKEYW